MSKIFRLKGHLRIYEHVGGNRYGKLVFDRDNLIVDQGLATVMDWLADRDYDNPNYGEVQPFGSIVCTNNSNAPSSDDVWSDDVQPYVLDEGFLHIGTSYASILNHNDTDNALSLSVEGLAKKSVMNGDGSQTIRSVCIVMGTNSSSGGPDQGDYSTSENERLFSRVSVGTLVKTSDKSFTFRWDYSISSE